MNNEDDVNDFPVQPVPRVNERSTYGTPHLRGHCLREEDIYKGEELLVPPARLGAWDYRKCPSRGVKC